MLIAGSSAVVTGGASGLGAATSARLASDGGRVFAVDLAAAIEAAPAIAGVTYIAADVTSEVEVRNAVDVASTAAPLRAVINCAGIAPSARILGRSGIHDLALYAKVVQINLVGTFTVMAVGAEAISQTEPDQHGQRGVVINTASIAAFDGQVGQIAYASSKAAVAGMTLPGSSRSRTARHPGVHDRARNCRYTDVGDRERRVSGNPCGGRPVSTAFVLA